ncbi:MAG: hypothetical protein M1444_00480 [Patescibacteria group bacterium]|nr:hypothetical protein [Patescibacteria group bacterium]
MGKFGGFYKGEKKKKKKDLDKTISSSQIYSPTLTMPEIISKKKKDY